MNDNNTPTAEGNQPEPTIGVAKIQVDGALTFIEIAKTALTGIDDILASGVELRADLLSGLTDSVLMLLGDAERHARQASLTLKALSDGDAK